MSEERKNIGYLYVNGLNDGKTKLQDRLARWWWGRKGAELEHAHVHWFDDQTLDAKTALVKHRVREMLRQYSGVLLVGSSAGGSLAFNAFHEMNNENVGLVTAHARLRVGDYPRSSRKSLYYRAHLGTDRPSRAFFDSVTRAENAAAALSPSEKQRILTLSSYVDAVVSPELMTIRGIQNHRARAVGHAGGFVAHLLADRNLIINFANERLFGRTGLA